MQRYGYTTATLAKKMGVFDSTVSRLMNGNPTIQKLRDLAAAIGCPLWEFFADEMPESEELRVKEATAQPEQPTHQPSNISHQPLASLQQAIICPHCHHALVFNVVSYEQK